MALLQMGTVSCTSLRKTFDFGHYSCTHAFRKEVQGTAGSHLPAASTAAAHVISSLARNLSFPLQPSARSPSNKERNMSVITPPPLASVQGAKLEDLTGKQSSIKSDDLWKDQAVLVLVLRRPGCVLCRGEAKSLWGKKAQFEELGVRMVCLVHEAIPDEINAFWPEYWGGELYLDTDKQLYKALGGGKLRRGSLMWFLNPWSVIWKHGKWAKEECGIKESNLKGDGLTMGGLMVIKQGAGGPSFAYAEERFGDHAEIDEVLKACQTAAQPSRM